MHHVVAGILIADLRVLLTLRNATREAYPETWALPGGHVEPGEREVEALRRELHEELGIDVLTHDLEPASRLHLVGTEPGDDLHLSTWRIRTWEDTPRNLQPDEHERITWFGAAELAGLVWAHPEHQPMLQDHLKQA